MKSSTPANLPPVLERLGELIGPDLERTNAIILEQLNSQVELIPKLGAHIIESGGKRLRPVLTLLSAKLFGYTGNDDALLAAVVEFIHTATLLHDDVVDRSDTRRGRATANSVWGSKAPILVGDYLFSRSFQILVAHADLSVLRIIADACAVISEGEVMQLVATNDLATSEEHYLEVVRRKTATLFAAAAQIGAVLNHRSRAEEEALARYGILLGTAYQLVDDALDYSATNEALGKNVGDDFQEGKITLPVIHAHRHGSPEERQFWSNCLEHKNFPDGALQRAIQLIRERGSLDYAMQRAQAFAVEAKGCLGLLPDTPEREAMSMLADFSVARSY
ncbi:MAG: polyprenyl synthetase family protein [Magnetococcus sp. YQC-9]